MKYCKKLLLLFATIASMAFFVISCRPVKNLNYMQGRFDTSKLRQVMISEPIIQKGDLLSVVVYSDNPTATGIYNQQLIIVPSGSNAANGSNNSVSGNMPSAPGYLVDEQGNIQLQTVGLFHVAGWTRRQLSDSLAHYFVNNNLLQNPYVTVRFLNFKFSMLGEVNHPGMFSIPEDHVSLFEALGLAGDLTLFARRDSVLVIREVNGQRQFGSLDLTSPNVMSSPFFYLQTNDVVIVDQTKKKQTANDQTTGRTISIAATVISTIAIVINLLRR